MNFVFELLDLKDYKTSYDKFVIYIKYVCVTLIGNVGQYKSDK